MSDAEPRSESTVDWRGTGVVLASALALYLSTMCREVYWGDSAELSARALSLDLSPVARAYPLHRALCWSLHGLLGDAALAANLLSAVPAALALAVLYEAGRRLGGCRAAGAAAAVVSGLAHTTWFYAGIAEVYALHHLILALAILFSIGAAEGSSRRRWALGVTLGLSLLHHRMIAFAAPGIVLGFVSGLRSVPAEQRIRRCAQVLGGFAAGAVPFLALCLTASREPPVGTTDPVAWWVRDVFLGGDKNAGHMSGAGRRSPTANALYVVRWILYNVPGPGLVLAVLGAVRLLRIDRRAAWLLLPMVPFHLVFPLRYDWTGDQFAFLSPLYPVIAILAAVGTRTVADRWGTRRTALAVAAAAVAPVGAYLVVAVTGFPPGRVPAERGHLPWHHDERPVTDRGRPVLEAVAERALLHADWGEGQVFKFLQIEGARRGAPAMRKDVRVKIWYDGLRLHGPPDDEWVAARMVRGALPAWVAPRADSLEPQGPGLFRARR